MLKEMAIKAASLLLIAGLVLLPGAGCTVFTESEAEPGPDFSLLKEAWDVVYEEYVEQEKLDDETLLRGAIKGMVDALDDPYSSYMDSDAYEMSASDLTGKFEGIGAYVGYDEGRIVIISPIPGSPADKAGIRAGDIIMAIDDESTVEMNIMDAVSRIRGTRGTPVSLLVLHEDETEPVEIEIIRGEIELVSVLFEMEEDIAHITITNFSERTGDELSSALEDMAAETASGIILDLRNNPGGLLSSVVEVASRFLEKGIIVSTVDNEGNRDELSVKRRGEVIDLPMVVLVNNYSASGSEVLAGALQDHERAVVAGALTFGKGSVNILHQLSDGSGLYITIGRWYTPGGRLIEGEGIEPDYTLDPEEQDAFEWALDYLKNSM
ncbi:MAG: S41 family peptidase [Dehalococcoidales bacterium]|nr:S41 family peptidase [Dehalococcoidales bacterium]